MSIIEIIDIFSMNRESSTFIDESKLNFMFVSMRSLFLHT